MRRVLAILLTFLAVQGVAEAKVPVYRTSNLNVEELAFNHGDAVRLSLAELSVFARRSDARIWGFDGVDWLAKGRKGRLVALQDFTDRNPSRRLGELLDVYRLDINKDGKNEYFVFVRGKSEDGVHYGATLFTERAGALELIFYPENVPGERYQMMDARDHDGDGRPEVIIAGEGGEGDFYTYYAVLAMDGDGVLRQHVLQAPETLHLMDMNQDGAMEFLVRKVVSRRGERPLFWTLVDRVHVWDGSVFQDEPAEYLSYHNEVTKARLIDELLDFHSEELLLLETKVEVLRQVHAHVVAGRPIGVKRDSSVAFARVALTKGRKKRARTLLERAIVEDPYRVDALYELAKLEMWASREREAIVLLYRALGVKPQSGPIWMTLGLCFSRLGEAETGIAAMVNSARLSEEPQARLSKLERLAETYRTKTVREHIARALEGARSLIKHDTVELEEVRPMETENP